ncbi:MAG: N-glycosylase/DNA lyase [Nitrososphaerota archaeon]
MNDNLTKKYFLRELENIYQNIYKDVEKKIMEIEKRSKSFSREDLFKEICFCILVANNNLEKTLEIWKRLGDDLLNSTKSELRRKLKSLGYRFYNKRAEYIIEARKQINDLYEITRRKEPEEIREWLVENIKGIGWKEASHFLRNLGYKNFAILDRHVLRILEKKNIIKEIPKSLTKRKYLEIENKLRELAEDLSEILKKRITLAELDFILFYLDAKKICEK